MYWYAIASLTPAAWLIVACLWGGAWAWVALIWVTGLVMLADRAAHAALAVRQDAGAIRFARSLAVGLACVHFAVLALGVRAVAGGAILAPESGLFTGAGSGLFQMLALAIALGMFMGQVSNPNAHELIHAANRRLRWLGTLVYISLLFGHHASAHPKVHHVHVATGNDPNSARRGQGFYAFWPRAWIGSFRHGLAAENATRRRRPTSPAMLGHPYLAYVGGAFAGLALAFGLAGWAGVLAYMVITTYAQMQLILADYVQHYGLRRALRDDGRPEPTGPHHSWNAPQWYSSAMMLNAPRHSDHHTHPMRLFPSLRLDPASMPILPHSLPVMAAIALVPPLWRRVMDPRVARWHRAYPTGRHPGGNTHPDTGRTEQTGQTDR